MKLQGAQQSEPGQGLGCKREPRRAGQGSRKRDRVSRSWFASSRIKHGVGSVHSAELYRLFPELGSAALKTPGRREHGRDPVRPRS